MCAALLLARAWAGPFWIVQSPLNLECALAVSLLARLLWGRA